MAHHKKTRIRSIYLEDPFTRTKAGCVDHWHRISFLLSIQRISSGFNDKLRWFSHF